MKKRLSSRILAIAAAAVIMTMLFASTSFAATTYTPVAGTSTTFEKYLIVESGANVPNVTFSYSIAAGTAQGYTAGSLMAIYAGNDAEKVTGFPTVNTTTFGPSDTTYTSVQTGDIDIARTASERDSSLTADTGVQFETAKGEKYAVKTATVDFSGVTFKEPGIYRYIITETASAADEAAGIMHDNDVDRILDVYVIDAGAGSAAVTEAWLYDGTEYATEAAAQAAADAAQGANAGEGDYSGITHREAQAAVAGGLQVASYVLHADANDDTIPMNASSGSNDVNTAGAALTDKTDGFTNEYKSNDLVVSKAVSGNQASKDKYFALTVTLAGLNPAGVYEVSIADDNDANTTDGNADATSGTTAATISANRSQTNPTTLTANASGEVTQTFYLQHGQSIAVRSLPINATFQVSENEEDYTPSYVIDSNAAVSANGMSAAQNFGNSDHTVAFTNTRDGIVPTGIFTVAWIALPIIAIAVVGLVLMHVKKNRRDSED